MSNKLSYEEILSKLSNVHKRGNATVAQCPVCGDEDHLYTDEKEGKTLAYCHKCHASLPAVLKALDTNNGGSPVAAKPPAPAEPKNPKDHGKRVERIVYTYRDPDGKEAYCKIREKYEDGHKKFSFLYTRPDGVVVYKKPKPCNNLYNLDRLAAAKKTETLYIVEGEKCADSMTAAGFLATSTNTGAESPNLSETDKEILGKFSNKIVIPDYDDPGRAYAEFWQQKQGARILPLPEIWPECPVKGDVADYLEADGDPEAIKNYKFPAEKYCIDAIETMDENAMSEEGFFIWLIGLPPTEQTRAEMKAMARARKLGIATVFKEALKAFKVKAAAQGQSRRNVTRYTDPPDGLSLACGDWIADDTGVKRLKSIADGVPQYADACTVPIMPVKGFLDRETGQYSVAVAFKRGNKWITITRPRQFWGESKKVNTLGNYGVPVDENSAKLLVKFISCCLNDNKDTLPELTSIGHLGWVED